jgi:hypothetical protein
MENEIYHLKKYFHKNNSVIHVQHTNDRDQIKTQSYNKIIFCYLENSAKTAYLKISDFGTAEK